MTNRYMDGQMGRKAETQTDRWPDGQTDCHLVSLLSRTIYFATVLCDCDWDQLEKNVCQSQTCLSIITIELHASKNVNNSFNTNIISYIHTSGGQSIYLYLNAVHFCNTSVNQTSVAALDNCFPALVSNT